MRDFKEDVCKKYSLSNIFALVAPGIFIDHWNPNATISNLFSGKEKFQIWLYDSNIIKIYKIRVKKGTNLGKSYYLKSLITLESYSENI